METKLFIASSAKQTKSQFQSQLLLKLDMQLLNDVMGKNTTTMMC